MLIAFSVAPSGTGRADGSVHDAVAAAVAVVRASGLPHRTTSDPRGGERCAATAAAG